MANDRKDGGKALAAERLALRRQLSQLSSKQKLDALIDSANARALVRSMPAEELYFAIADVGLADTTDIVQLASPAQFRTFVDLGGWTKDRFEPHQLFTWLRAARGDEGADLLAKVRALDAEVVHLLIRESIHLHDLEEDPDVNPAGVTMETPEGRYLIEFKVEGPEQSLLRSLINELLAENPLEAVRMLESTRWELSSELEEIGFRFRSGRLQDLGFPQLDEALAVFTRVDVPPVAAPAPGTALAPSRERIDYLQAAVAGMDDEERDALEDELRYLANAVLVAEAADPGDLHAVRRVTEMTRDYLSLGLEHLCGGEPKRALEVARDHALRQVFRIGFSLTLQLKFRADRLAKQPLAKQGDAWLLLSAEADAISALRRKRPLRAIRVEGAEPMPFRSGRELLESGAILDRAERQVAVLRGLLGGTAESAKAVFERLGAGLDVVGAERLLLAAIADAALGGDGSPRPISNAEREPLEHALFEAKAGGVALKADVVAPIVEKLAAKAEPAGRAEVEPMVRAMLGQLLEEHRAAAGPSQLLIVAGEPVV